MRGTDDTERGQIEAATSEALLNASSSAIAAPPRQSAEMRDLVRAGRLIAYRAILLAAALIIAGLVFHELVTLIVAGLITVIVAMIISGVAGRLERWRVPRLLGAVAGVLCLLAGLGAVIALIVTPMVSQVQDFVDRVPELSQSLSERFGTVAGEQSGERLQRTLQGYVDEPARVVGPVASVGLNVASIASAILVILITAFYMAARPQPLLVGLLRLFPPTERENAAQVMERLRTAWTGWLRGVAVDMVITGLLLYLGLTLIGLDFAILFAVLSALLVVVPYFGAFIGGVPPVLLALTESPELALATFVVYLVVQQIEGNIIVPVIMSKTTKLHPAMIAIGVVVVSQLFGIVGVLVAVPILSTVVILTEELWVKRLERPDRSLIRAPEGRLTT